MYMYTCVHACVYGVVCVLAYVCVCAAETCLSGK